MKEFFPKIVTSKEPQAPSTRDRAARKRSGPESLARSLAQDDNSMLMNNAGEAVCLHFSKLETSAVELYYTITTSVLPAVRTCRAFSYMRTYSRAEVVQEKSFAMPLRMSVRQPVWSLNAARAWRMVESSASPV